MIKDYKKPIKKNKTETPVCQECLDSTKDKNYIFG
jgi:hypothetical protein